MSRTLLRGMTVPLFTAHQEVDAARVPLFMSHQTGMLGRPSLFPRHPRQKDGQGAGNQPTASGNQPVVEMEGPEMQKRGN